MTYVVAFNGPPQCGKDTAKDLLLKHMDKQGVNVPVITKPLSWPLRLMAFGMTGWNRSADYEEFKKTYFEQFNCTGRQLMIDCHEKFLKPTYGRNALAKILIGSLEESFPVLVCITDIGFQYEYDFIQDHFKFRNVHLIRMARDGCDFSNDSRELVYNDYPFVESYVENSGTLEDLNHRMHKVYGQLVNQRGWKL